MQRYGVGDHRQFQAAQTVSHISKKYPEGTFLGDGLRLKCEGRTLRDRTRKMGRVRKQSNYRQRVFERAVSRAFVNNAVVFNCHVCKDVLTSPVTVECGHTFCAGCLGQNDVCLVCKAALTHHRTRCVNVLVQDLVEKWRERYKSDFDVITDVLGVEPRYHLRSGRYGVFKYSDQNRIDDKSSHFLNQLQGRLPKAKCDKRILEESNGRSLMNFDPSANFRTDFNFLLKEVECIKEEAIKSSWTCITSTDLECTLCSRCLLDPVTTDCGHTFCRECLTRVLDHNLSCPLCMAPLGSSVYSRGSTIALDDAVKLLVPMEYEERLGGSLRESLSMDNGTEVAVFVCTNAFPGVACPLYVSEPRYRLLVRRCLRSSTKRFAMAGRVPNEDKFVDYGTILEVKDAVYLEDGRFILTAIGVKRYKVIRRGEQDGYDTAVVDYIKDTPVSPEKLPELIALHERVHFRASTLVLSLKPKARAEVERLIGPMPTVEENWHTLPDGPAWTWWLMHVLPPDTRMQVFFLSASNLEKRLRAIDKMFERIKTALKIMKKRGKHSPLFSLPEDYTDLCDEERL